MKTKTNIVSLFKVFFFLSFCLLKVTEGSAQMTAASCVDSFAFPFYQPQSLSDGTITWTNPNQGGCNPSCSVASSTQGGSGDYTSTISFTVTAGNNETITMTNTIYCYTTVGIWIDWNNDGIFQTSEYVAGSTQGGGCGNQSMTFFVPGYIPSGQYRMRVISCFTNLANVTLGQGTYAFAVTNNACMNFFNSNSTYNPGYNSADYEGGWFDFTLNVINNYTCYPPQSLSTTAITGNSVNFQWVSPPNPTQGYQWVVLPNGGVPGVTTPVVNGYTLSNVTTATSGTILNSSTTYCLYVRSICGSLPIDTSIWTLGTCFTTLSPPCSTLPQAVNITTPSVPVGNPVCYGSPYTMTAINPNTTVSGVIFHWAYSTNAGNPPWTMISPISLGGSTGFTTLSYTASAMPALGVIYFTVFDSCSNNLGAGGVHGNVDTVHILYYTPPYSEDFYSTPNNAEPLCYKKDVDPMYGQFAVQHAYVTANGINIIANVMPFLNACCNTPTLSEYFTIPALNLLANTTYTVTFDYSRSNTQYQPHLQLWANNTDPGTQWAGGSPNVTSTNNPLLITDLTVTGNGVTHAVTTFTTAVAGITYLSWYTNTTEAQNISYGTSVGISNINVYISNPCVTPSAQPTSLSLASNVNSVSGTFTPVSGVNHYLVVRTNGTATVTGGPINGTTYTTGSTCGNGYVVAVAHTPAFTDLDLVANSQYTYTIFSVNDLCGGGPLYDLVSPLTGTISTTGPQTYVWNQTVKGDWNTPSNWTPSRNATDISDVLIFNNSVTDTAYNVPNQVISRLQIINNSVVRLWAVAGGATLTIASDGDATTNELSVNAGSILYLDGSTNAFKLNYSGVGGTGVINGILEMVETANQNVTDFTGAVTTVSVTGSLNEGGVSSAAGIVSQAYNLNVLGTLNFKYTSVNGPALPWATWGTGSTMLISGYTSAAAAPGGATFNTYNGGFGQSFYNFTYNCPNQTSNSNWAGALGLPSFNVRGTFTMTSTGTGSLILAGGSQPYRTQVNNYAQTGGALYISNAGGAAIFHFQVAGNFNQTGGVFGSQGGSFASIDQCLTFNGAGTQNVNFSSNPVGPVTFRFINPNGINLTTTSPLSQLTINPGGGIRVSSLCNNPITTTVPIVYTVYTGSTTIPNPRPSSLTYDSVSGGSTISAAVWPATNGPLFVVINIGQSSAITLPFNRTLSYVTAGNTASGCGILQLTLGNLNIGNDTLTLGVNNASYGQLWAAPTSMIQVTAGGTLTRWIPTTANPTSFASASASADAREYFPLSAGGAPRFVQLFQSVAATTTAGTISVTHTPLTLLTPVSVTDGAYNITQRTNASWTIKSGNGLNFTGSFNLRINAGNLFTSPNPGNLRALYASSIVGTQVSGGSLTITNNPLPYYYAQRSGLSTAQLTTAPWYIGANGSTPDISVSNIWTAINTGAWNTASTWDVGTVPPATGWCYINPGVNVTVGSTGDVGKYLVNNGTLTVSTANTKLTIDSFLYNNGTINVSGSGTTDSLVVKGSYSVNPALAITSNNYGTWNVSGGVMRLGPVGGGKTPFANYGTLNVSGGTMAVNGNMNFSNANGLFTQTGGLISVDGNAHGVQANSVPNGTADVNFGSNNNFHLTNGTLQIVDPTPYVLTGTLNSSSGMAWTVLQYTGSTYLDNNIVKPHNIQFGDGVSTDAGGTDVGFAFYSNIYLALGDLTVNGGNGNSAGTNRNVSWAFQMRINGKLTVMPYGKIGGYVNPSNNYSYSQWYYFNDSIVVMDHGLALFFYTYSNSFQSGTYYTSLARITLINNNTSVTNGGIFAAYNGSVYWPNYTVSIGSYYPSAYYQYWLSAQATYLGNISIPYINYWEPMSAYGGNPSYYNGPNVITAPSTYNSNPNYVVEAAGSSLSSNFQPSQINGWINGFYQKHATTGGIGHTYWIGDSAWFTPVTLTNMPGQTAISANGDIAVRATVGQHPNIATSGLNPLKVLGRYYSILPTPVNMFNPGTMFATFDWVAGDVPQGSLPNSFICARDSAGTFVNATPHWLPKNYPWSAVNGAANISSPLGSAAYPLYRGVITNVGNMQGDFVFGENCPHTTISTQPQSLNICSNIPASFDVEVGGLGLNFQWYKNGVALVNGGNISGATSSTLSLASAAVGDVGNYYVIITSTCDVPVTSNTATLAITQAAVITSTYQSAPTLCVSGTDSIIITAIGQPPLTYKWYKNGVLQSQWNNQTTVVISNANVTNSAVYTITATNICRTDSTNPGDTLNVNPAPPAVITPQGPATFCAGDSVLFISDSAVGYNYVWHINGVAVPADNTPRLMAYANAGYNVTITDANGCTATSATDSVTTLALPVATIGSAGPLAFCQGGNVTLNTNVGAGLSYQWQLGGVGSSFSDISGAVSSTYVVSAAGRYRVKVINGSGCYAISAVDTVSVNTPPAVTASAAGPVAFCQGGSVTLHTNPTNGSYTYSWKLNGVNLGGPSVSSYTVNASGSYTDSVTDANGCTTTTNAVVVTVNPLPVATATALSSTSICPGGSVVLEANVGAGLNYQWNNTGGPIGGATNISYTATVASNYTVKVTNSVTGCFATSTPSITVTVNAATVNVTASPSNSTVCQGNAVGLTATGCAGCTYQWYENTPTGYIPISGQTANNYSATVQGSYHVVGTNGTGCSAISNNDSVTILPVPTSSATALGAVTFCTGGSVNIVASPYSATPPGYTYEWYQNGSLMSNTTDTINVSASAAYYVIVTNSGGCFATSNTINVTALANPSPSITIGAPGTLSTCTGVPVILNGSPLGAGYTYQWYEDTGTGYFTIPAPLGTAVNYGALATGNYKLQVTTTAAGCTGMSTPDAVFVNPIPYQSTSGPAEFCFGSNITLYAHGGSGTNLHFDWYKVGLPNVLSNDTFYNTYQQGQYYCVETVTGNGCTMITDTTTVTIDPLPVVPVNYASGQLYTDPFTSYQWYKNGVLIPGATSQYYTPTSPGDYKVLATNNKGCNAYSTTYHYMDGAGVGGVNSGIAVNIYPNPATSYIRIDAPVKVNVYISSLEGKTVMHQDEATSMDINGLANGVYMIKVYDKEGSLLKVDKLVKDGN